MRGENALRYSAAGDLLAGESGAIAERATTIQADHGVMVVHDGKAAVEGTVVKKDAAEQSTEAIACTVGGSTI